MKAISHNLHLQHDNFKFIITFKFLVSESAHVGDSALALLLTLPRMNCWFVVFCNFFNYYTGLCSLYLLGWN